MGDRKSDEELAKNIGVKFYQCEVNGTFPRLATIERKTKETLFCRIQSRNPSSPTSHNRS